MSFLPKIRNTSAQTKVENIVFNGLDKTASATSAGFSDTRNVTSADFPFISARKSRFISKLPEGMTLLGADGTKDLYFVLGDGEKSYFYFNGEVKAEWQDTDQKKKFFCENNGSIYIFPDKKFYRTLDVKAQEFYKSTNSRVGITGTAKIYPTDSTTSVTSNKFKIKHDVSDFKFQNGDWVRFWAYDKNTGEKADFFGLSEPVEMESSTEFKSTYFIKYNMGSAKNHYQMADSDYINIEYEITYPRDTYEAFKDFSVDVSSSEVFRDEDDNQYILIRNDRDTTVPKAVDMEEMFLRYSFEGGMNVYFTYTDDSLVSIIPKNAATLETGVKEFKRKSGAFNEVSAYFKVPAETITPKSWETSSSSGWKYAYLDYPFEISAGYPDISGGICVNNRLWAYDGNVIRASSLGKPYILTNYKTTSVSSWSVETNSKRNITAVTSYGSVPHFFSEDRIIKVYGSAPSTFQTQETMCQGVKEGSQRSVVIAGGILCYLDTDGNIASYTGSYPQVISKRLNESFESAIGCADSKFIYYILESKSGAKKIYIFDIQNSIWLCEGDKGITDMVYSGCVYFFKDGFIESTEDIDLGFDKYIEKGYESFIEFPTNDESIFNKKKLKKLLLKINAEKGTSLRVEVKETEYGTYRSVFEKTIAEGDGVLTIPIDGKRTLGYAIRISGKGIWRLEGIMRKITIGSYK